MNRVSTRRILSAVILAFAASVLVGCGGPPRSPEHPTYERVAVNQRAIGIPYGAVALFRVDDQLVALRVVDAPFRGFAIEYEWNVSPADSAVFETAAAGAGETDEKEKLGAVRAGPLYLKWSRGSGESGWLYWPEDSKSVSVCSITFRSVASINLQDPQIFWYKREMFE
jgi:hypothetical protein